MKKRTKQSGLVALCATVLGLGALFVGDLPTASEQTPQAILVLGGAPSREQFAAQFALDHPQLPIWVSSGSPVDYAEYVFQEAGIPLDRVTLDYRAVDTVTNFTTLVDDFAANDITDVYVITSDYHMPRAKVIGKIVLGSQGIRMHPVEIPSKYNQELAVKSWRDGARSVFWTVTGTTLSLPRSDEP
ncbi:protein of unknown function DUF218 [Thalassoporum mexicanum PCC 7367]|uniref:YdcF family protein n=1 Tax=Thalassoporum mexicanum TaxID=3457544 RepID=UPI00029FA409|nr:YdcF family protein [Pseudanabaena sp. PCC 7367]AFY69769.1 protein of unknown function DUF218 [Pseudanabaena sp. PCC 7367]